MFDNVGSSIQWSPLLHLSKAVRSKTCQTGTKLVCLAPTLERWRLQRKYTILAESSFLLSPREDIKEVLLAG